MGNMAAAGMVEAGGATPGVLSWHLKSNHYPPIPGDCVGVAAEALRAIAEGEPERPVGMRDVGVHRVYGAEVPAWVIAEAWHLDVFVAEVLGAVAYDEGSDTEWEV